MTASFSERWIAMKITELVNKILEDAEFVDMTRMMEEGMPYWPTQPAFEAETIESQELGNESYFRKIVMCEHTGTHIDAGCHFVPGKPSVDEIPVTQIFGRAVNIDVTDTAPSGVVSVEKYRILNENTVKSPVEISHFSDSAGIKNMEQRTIWKTGRGFRWRQEYIFRRKGSKRLDVTVWHWMLMEAPIQIIHFYLEMA